MTAEFMLVFYCFRVKRKEQSSTGNARLCGGKNSMEALEIADKQPANKHLQLVAKEEFIKETGGYESESEEEEDEDEDKPSSGNNTAENADSKKRKASRKLKSPKYVLKSSKRIFRLLDCNFGLF